MDNKLSSPLLEQAINEFSKLPGIGRKTALRLVLHLLRLEKERTSALSNSLINLRENIKYCKVCHNICDTDICSICDNPQRDHQTICIVENIQTVLAIENTGTYHGIYHVLGGLISPMDGIGPSDLEIQSLIERIDISQPNELIFALSPTMEGDTTNFYIQRKLANFTDIKLTTLSRGISVGDELEYTDEVTLGRSITSRIELSRL